MKVITAKFATYCYCEAGDHDINPGDQIEKFEGCWSHHTCAETLRGEYREADRLEREKVRQERKDALTDSDPRKVLDAVIKYAREIWPHCQGIETDVKQRWWGNDGYTSVEPYLRTATGFIDSDEFHQRARDLYSPACYALIQIACEHGGGIGGVRYP